MKIFTIFYLIFFSTNIFALPASSRPGMHKELKRRFEQSTTAVQLSDLPTFVNRYKLTCLTVGGDDIYTNFSGVLFTTTKIIPGSGPLFPNQKITKPFYIYTIDYDEDKLVQEFFDFFSFSIEGESMRIQMDSNPLIGFTAVFEFKKSDFIYLKTLTNTANDYGYCYPTK